MACYVLIISGTARIALHGSNKKHSDKCCQVLGKFMGTVKFVGPFGGSLRLFVCLLVGWLAGWLADWLTGWLVGWLVVVCVGNSSMYHFFQL